MARETPGARFPADVCVVGGAGHVGLPLAIAFAARGTRVIVYDTNRAVLEEIGAGRMPFLEHGAEPLLAKALGTTLELSSDMRCVARARHVVIAIGTPVDEYLNPKLRALLELMATLRPHLSPEQTLIVRSTVYPRTCRQIAATLGEGGPWHVAYCPERIVEGQAIREIGELPQLVAGVTERALEDAARLFALLAPQVIRTSIEEAELAKLFSNAWRYIQFAVANQFYMFAEELGVDYSRVRKAMVEGYGRAASLPGAGFAAGPCLLKDTLQLAAFNNQNFQLGMAAMSVNEGLPGFLVDRLRQRRDLARTRVGILGMAFKADIDDTRSSLSYKLGKILRFHGARVLYSDEYARDPTFVTREELLAGSDVVIVAVPHTPYRGLVIPSQVEVIDLWGVVRREG